MSDVFDYNIFDDNAFDTDYIIVGGGGYTKQREWIDWAAEEDSIMAVITAFLYTRKH